MIRPTLRQFDYLIALQNEGSFSEAARQCHVTQSTLSAGIKDLENALKQTLVNRGRQGITLTPFGTEVASAAKSVLRDVDNIVHRARDIEAPLTGPLRLGVIPTIAPYMLPAILPALKQKFPKLELALHEDLTDRLLEKLDRGQIDLALMAFPYDTPGYHQEILWDEPFILACTDKDPYKKSVKTDDLDADRLLLLEDGHCLRDHALSACKLMLPKKRKTYSTTSLATLLQMVEHGYGITLIPKMAAEKTTLPAHIRLVPFRDPKPVRKIGLLWPKGHLKHDDFELLAKTIKSSYKA